MAALTISKEEEQRLKGLGFLNNKGTDNFSDRVITVNGKVTVAQHRCLADNRPARPMSRRQSTRPTPSDKWPLIPGGRICTWR